jgi:hypothetical protein
MTHDMREALADCCTRMERARGILQADTGGQWAMLDTTDARAALSAAPEADTILRELVEATRQLHSDGKLPEAVSRYGDARKAAFAWADAQKAPQPRTAEPPAFASLQFPDGVAEHEQWRMSSIIEAAWQRDASKLALALRSMPATRAEIEAEPAPAPADEPPPLDIIAQAKRILVLVDRCIENHTTGNRSDLRAALLDELGAAKLQAEGSQP